MIISVNNFTASSVLRFIEGGEKLSERGLIPRQRNSSEFFSPSKEHVKFSCLSLDAAPFCFFLEQKKEAPRGERAKHK
jgi:hypothetical protein